tara:strand:+ start:690 stop:1322 length:633 start_codon:yes stop_codon:yes gene_type:complete
MDQLARYIDFNDEQLWFSAATVIAAPVIWNILARLEYFTHILTKIFLGSPYLGCYALAVWIFSFSLFRDYQFMQMMESQPTVTAFDEYEIFIQGIAGAMFCFGGILVLSSMWALGVTGTYLGDYFGILMKERVTGFPFNVTDDPMYDGSTIIFLSHALYHRSPAGLLIALLVWVMYKIALFFESPFTTRIYAQKNAKSNNNSKKSKKKSM